MDFTLKIYQKLLQTLIKNGYAFQTFEAFLLNPKSKVIILRHDVDARKYHSLEFAKIQSKLGIVGSYYFRMVPASFDEKVILEIHQLGHEIGYHYEDMDFAKGDKDLAIQYFEKHLAQLREIVPVSTICMHGSPKSKFDNKDVWQKYDYKKYNIIGEPYFDLNFNEIFYLTDTGRMWDGHQVSVRDKVKLLEDFPTFHSTQEIIKAIENQKFPSQVMFNFHPQRWTNHYFLWLNEKIIQFFKNKIKAIIVKKQFQNK